MSIHYKMEFLVYHQRQLRRQETGQGWTSGEKRGADGPGSSLEKLAKIFNFVFFF